MKRTLVISIIISLFLIVACDNDEEKNVSLSGKWILNSASGDVSLGGLSIVATQAYNSELDQNYNALFFEFSSNKLKVYSREGFEFLQLNQFFLEVNYDNTSKRLTLSLPGFGSNSFPFKKTGSNLTLTLEGNTSNQDVDLKFVKFSGTLPPSIWSTGVTEDSFETDNDVGSSNTLIVGNTYQKHSLTTDDNDWFTFSGTHGNTYQIQVRSYMDTYLYLYDTNAITLVDSNDDNILITDLDVSSSIIWTADGSGNFYIKVNAYDPSDEGFYGIEIKNISN